jgi:hypothetical protein
MLMGVKENPRLMEGAVFPLPWLTWWSGRTIGLCALAHHRSGTPHGLLLTIKSATPVSARLAASHDEKSVFKNRMVKTARTSRTIPAKRRLRFTLRRSSLGSRFVWTGPGPPILSSRPVRPPAP